MGHKRPLALQKKVRQDLDLKAGASCCMWVPKGFHRIRHYGLLANGNRAANIAHARKLLAVGHDVNGVYFGQVINFAQTDGRDRYNLSANCSKTVTYRSLR
jgi:hypothetical protein